MSRHLTASATVVSLSLVGCLAAFSAQAGTVSFVSSKGTNTGNCSSPASPCLTFQYALGQTSAGGVIKALDPGNYWSVIINKSITLTGVPGASIYRFSTGDAVTINAGANGVVYLRDLEIDGFGVALGGVRLTSGKSLTIENCVVRRVAADGVAIVPSSGNTTVTISNSLISNTGNMGVELVPSGAATVKGAVSQTILANNGFAGILVSPGATAMITDTSALNNATDGFRAVGAGATMRVGRSVATNNGTGVDNVSGATVQSYGDNKIDGNAADVSGSFTVIPMR